MEFQASGIEGSESIFRTSGIDLGRRVRDSAAGERLSTLYGYGGYGSWEVLSFHTAVGRNMLQAIAKRCGLAMQLRFLRTAWSARKLFLLSTRLKFFEITSSDIASRCKRCSARRPLRAASSTCGGRLAPHRARSAASEFPTRSVSTNHYFAEQAVRISRC